MILGLTPIGRVLDEAQRFPALSYERRASVASSETERRQVRVPDLETYPHGLAGQRCQIGIPGPDYGSLQIIAIAFVAIRQCKAGKWMAVG